MRSVLQTLAAACLWATLAASAAELDLHAWWDDRCASCHGDAGDFARRTLTLHDNRLAGRHHGDDLDRFLQQHHGAGAMLPRLTAMLTAQLGTTPLYQQHCKGCHGAASAFARSALVVRNGTLVGREGGRAVRDVLARHGGLQPPEADAVAATLARVHGEVTGIAPGR